MRRRPSLLRTSQGSAFAWLVAAWFAVTPTLAEAQALTTLEDGTPGSVITGRALRAYDDLPLAGAVVYIEDSDVTTVADADGYFGLGPLAPGMYKVLLFHAQLSELGWVESPAQLVIVPPATDIQVDFFVDRAGIMIEAGGAGSQDNPYFLDPLTIVGKRSIFERPAEMGARVDFVALDEIREQETSARHIGDLIRDFPSLSVYEPHPGMVCVAARRRTTDTPNPGSELRDDSRTGAGGVNSSRLCPKMVQVYIDDIAVFRAEEVLTTISPQNIERIEYVNGVAAGARFGTGYAEGVLMLYTRRPTINKKKP